MNEVTFNGIVLNDYCDYIFLKNTEDIPERVYDEVEVPGRNGKMLIDKEYYRNVSREYTVIIMSDDCYERYREFVNVVCTQTGYCQLIDSDMQDVYMVAKVNPVTAPVTNKQRNALKFTLSFDRKPQRFLLSGTNTVELSGSSATITNPTAFESSPLLTVYGAGAIYINDDLVQIVDDAIGNVRLSDSIPLSAGTSKTISFANLFNEGDYITFENGQITVQILATGYVTSASVSFTGTLAPETYSLSTVGPFITLSFAIPQNAQALPSSWNFWSASFTVFISIGSNEGYVKGYFQENIYPSDEEIFVTTNFSEQSGNIVVRKNMSGSFNGIVGVSTVGGSYPFMVDLDSLKAYKQVGDSVVSLNHLVEMGTDIPSLKPGENEISINTSPSTQLDIVPRWWKL